ncbi:MAG: hypothetical protein AAF384_07760 [Pseudomonadota bacterium]
MLKISFIGLLCAQITLCFAEEEMILDAPENAYWHGPSQSWFVSNLGGGLSLDKDGVGWVARFDASGAVAAPRWVDGLDAPTGMAAYDGDLYVTDRGRVHQIEINSAKIKRSIALPDSQFLNDVAATADGRIFVTDTATNRIYEITAGEVKVWVESTALQNPNGLWVDGDKLIIAAWGPMTDVATFATEHPGTLLQIDLGTKEITPVGKGEPIANFDGVVSVEDAYFATDWTGGRLLKISKKGEVSVVLSGFQQLADLGFNPQQKQLGLPVMKDNRFILLSLEP